MAYLITISGTAARQTAEIMKTAYMPLTPLWFFTGTILLVAVIIAYYGLEVIGRALEIIFYLFLFFLIIFFLLAKEFSPALLQLILEKGINPDRYMHRCPWK